MITIEKEYPTFYFRQSDKSPVQCSFVATSADVSDWASVPIKTSMDLKNFQRPEIESHVNEIDEFFSKFRENCSPSSIVVGFRHPIECLDKQGKKINLNDITTGKVVEGKVVISYINPMIEDNSEKEEILVKMIADLINNLSEEIKRLSEDSNTIECDDEEKNENLFDMLDIEDDTEEVFYNSSDVINSKQYFLDTLKSLKVDNLSLEEMDEWFFRLLDLNKAGLIIDGQHRVKGTKKNNILFNITAIPDATWPELAFQFIVLNKSAKKVPDSLLINIVGNSLNEEELNSIERRLNDSGIQVPLYQGVMKIHEDPESPFYGKLKFGLEDETGIIDASAAKTKIVNYWFKCNVYELIEHLLKGKSKKEKIQYWVSSGLWYEYLKIFWNTAKDFYSSNSSLWEDELEKDGKTPASKLMRVTIINLTQFAFIEQMKNSLDSIIKNDVNNQQSMEKLIPDIKEFQKYIELYFKRLQPEFFTEWSKTNAKGFDGSKAIKDAYVEAVTLVIKGDKTIAELKSKNKPNNAHLLFRD